MLVFFFVFHVLKQLLKLFRTVIAVVAEITEIRVRWFWSSSIKRQLTDCVFFLLRWIFFYHSERARDIVVKTIKLVGVVMGSFKWYNSVEDFWLARAILFLNHADFWSMQVICHPFKVLCEKGLFWIRSGLDLWPLMARRCTVMVVNVVLKNVPFSVMVSYNICKISIIHLELGVWLLRA